MIGADNDDQIGPVIMARPPDLPVNMNPENINGNLPKSLSAEILENSYENRFKKSFLPLFVSNILSPALQRWPRGKQGLGAAIAISTPFNHISQ